MGVNKWGKWSLCKDGVRRRSRFVGGHPTCAEDYKRVQTSSCEANTSPTTTSSLNIVPHATTTTTETTTTAPSLQSNSPLSVRFKEKRDIIKRTKKGRRT